MNKVKVSMGKYSLYPIHNNPFKKPKKPFSSFYKGWMGKKKFWFLHCNGAMKYDTVNKCWTFFAAKWVYGLNFKSLKAIVRHLRKQKIPYGTEFEICGWAGEIYTITVNSDKKYIEVDSHFTLN